MKFEITEKGFYKTRDGRRAYVYYIDKEVYEHNHISHRIAYCIDDDSHYGGSIEGIEWEGSIGENDLISKWED
jgi:hypothetical protein